MKKFMFFPIWKFDELEYKLKEMEKQGYRLDYIKYSYFFYFKKSKEKDMNYFITFNTSRKFGSGFCDYNVLTNHKGNEINTQYCYYNIYRIADSSENLDHLYEFRREIVLTSIRELFFSVLFLFIIFFIVLMLSISASLVYYMYFSLLGSVILFAYSIYYLFAFLKQKKKVKEWLKNNSKIDF